MGTYKEDQGQEVKEVGDTWKSPQFVVCIRPRSGRNKRRASKCPRASGSASPRKEVKVGRSKGHEPWSANCPAWQERKGREEQVSQQELDRGVISSRTLTYPDSNMSPGKRHGTGERER